MKKVTAICLALLFLTPVILNAGQMIETKLVGDFDGYEHDNYYVMTNGQIWRQTDFHFDFHFAFRPDATIFRKNGAWFLHVEDMDSVVQVERIK